MDPEDKEHEDHPHFEDALKAALEATSIYHEASKRFDEQAEAYESVGLDVAFIDVQELLNEVASDAEQEKADEEFGDGDPSQWTW